MSDCKRGAVQADDIFHSDIGNVGNLFSAQRAQHRFTVENSLIIGAGQGITADTGNGSADREEVDFFHRLFVPLFKSALAGGFVQENGGGTGDIE